MHMKKILALLLVVATLLTGFAPLNKNIDLADSKPGYDFDVFIFILGENPKSIM